jgi:hypothetical protein
MQGYLLFVCFYFYFRENTIICKGILLQIVYFSLILYYTT